MGRKKKRCPVLHDDRPHLTTYFPPHTSHTRSRLELLHQMSQYAPNGPALIADAFGWESSDGQGEVGLSVHLPAPDGYGLHLVASNASFARRAFAMSEIHQAFLDKRTLHFALSALYVRACLCVCMLWMWMIVRAYIYIYVCVCSVV